MNRYFLAFLQSPKRIVLSFCVLFALALSIFWIQDRWTLKHSNTKRSIEYRIQNQVPEKATKVWVQSWIVSQGWSYRNVTQNSSQSSHSAILIGVPKTTDRMIIQGTTHIEFIFDKNDNLRRYKVEEILTGL